jgi:hypothetical protein
MAGKVLILAGAPPSSSLDWDSANLLSSFQEPIARFVDQDAPSAGGASAKPGEYAAWRSLPLERVHLPTGFSQNYAGSGAVFFNVSFTSVDEHGGNDTTASQQLLSQFYEHSLAMHDETHGSSFISTTTSSSSGATDTSEQSQEREPMEPPGGGHLSDLEDVPDAAYLTKIHPRTMTVNLIVGIISIAAPRNVKTRWGSTKTLVEVLVGDETKSGFAVTFWLPSENVNQSVLAGLRPQDIVLLQNVALNVFMAKVYGSSLRHNRTKVHLLFRRKLDATDVGGYYRPADVTSTRPVHPQLDKTRQVHQWVLHFVGQSRGKASTRAWDQPPEDTQ